MPTIKGDAHLGTRVGRRLYLVFVLGVVLPMSVALATSYLQVRNELQQQNDIRLRRGAKEAGLAIFDRLELINNELAVVAGAFAADPTDVPEMRVDSSLTTVPRFRWVALRDSDGNWIPVTGTPGAVEPLVNVEIEQMSKGRAVTRTSFETSPRILMARAVNDETPSEAVVWSEVDPVYLWRAGDQDVGSLVSDGDLCVFVGDEPLHCPFFHSENLSTRLSEARSASDGGLLEWNHSEGPHVAGFWTLFLEYGYLTDKWAVVLTQPESGVVAPIADFRRTFILVVLLSVLVIAYLVNREVHRIIRPLLALKEGTARLGRQEFDDPVVVTSNDEFHELATSFNRMTLRLKNAFEEEQRLSTELEASEGSLRTIVESAADAILTCREDGHITSVNATCEAMFGFDREEAATMRLSMLVPAVGYAGLDRYVADNGTDPAEVDGFRSDGSDFPLELVLRPSPAGADHDFMVFASDLTERHVAEAQKLSMEKQLLRAEKLETMGALAGGIAHDFNNLLTPIRSYIDLALLDVSEGTPIWEDLRGAKGAAIQAQELVQQLLRYGRGSTGSKADVSLPELVRSTVRLVRTSLPPKVAIECDLPDECLVPGDPGQLSQVIMNLCRNGCQAMEDTGGTLRVTLGKGETSRSGSVFKPKHPVDRHVRLTVSDTGVGIEQELMDQLFEPLFTTKGVDKGTGLGLSVVQRIVANHDGWVTVESEVDKGTSFHVFLPLAGEGQGAVEVAAAGD